MANTTTRRARKKVPSNETAEEKFTRLVNARGNKLKHQLKLLRNLSTSYAYKIDPILTATWLAKFDEEFTALKGAWEASLTKSKPKVAEETSAEKTS